MITGIDIVIIVVLLVIIIYTVSIECRLYKETESRVKLEEKVGDAESQLYCKSRALRDLSKVLEDYDKDSIELFLNTNYSNWRDYEVSYERDLNRYGYIETSTGLILRVHLNGENSTIYTAELDYFNMICKAKEYKRLKSKLCKSNNKKDK